MKAPLGVLLALVLLGIPRLVAGAQTTVAVPAITISPGAGPTTVHAVQATGLPPNTTLPVLLISPAGDETVNQMQTDASGALTETFTPPDGGWDLGVYRVVVGLGNGSSISTIFGVNNGQPNLLVEPYLPSPTSAFIFEGVGYPANTLVTLTVHLTGGEAGQPIVRATTDGDGNFVAYLWPQQAGYTFFAAGMYEVDSDSPSLSTSFMVREHPVSAAVAVNGAAPYGGSVPVSFMHYHTGRYLWGVIARLGGRVVGEFLTSPVDAAGVVQIALSAVGLDPGQYLIATPYDWGEGRVTVDQPPTPTPTPVPSTSTPTPTPKPTVKPKATARPTPKATPRPTAKHHKTKRSCKYKWKHHKKVKVCKG